MDVFDLMNGRSRKLHCGICGTEIEMLLSDGKTGTADERKEKIKVSRMLGAGDSPMYVHTWDVCMFVYSQVVAMFVWSCLSVPLSTIPLSAYILWSTACQGVASSV